MLASGLGPRFSAARHVGIPADAHASVFVPTAVVQFTASDAEDLNAAFTTPELEEFIGRWQALYPYKVVWANHAALV